MITLFFGFVGSEYSSIGSTTSSEMKVLPAQFIFCICSYMSSASRLKAIPSHSPPLRVRNSVSSILGKALYASRRAASGTTSSLSPSLMSSWNCCANSLFYRQQGGEMEDGFRAFWTYQLNPFPANFTKAASNIHWFLRSTRAFHSIKNHIRDGIYPQ